MDHPHQLIAAYGNQDSVKPVAKAYYVGLLNNTWTVLLFNLLQMLTDKDTDINICWKHYCSVLYWFALIHFVMQTTFSRLKSAELFLELAVTVQSIHSVENKSCDKSH